MVEFNLLVAVVVWSTMSSSSPPHTRSCVASWRERKANCLTGAPSHRCDQRWVIPKRDMRRSYSCIPSPFSWAAPQVSVRVKLGVKQTYLFFPSFDVSFRQIKFRDDPSLGLLGMSMV